MESSGPVTGLHRDCVSFTVTFGSRDSSVGIATHYGLDGPGIESRWGRDFLHLSRSALRVPGLNLG